MKTTKTHQEEQMEKDGPEVCYEKEQQKKGEPQVGEDVADCFAEEAYYAVAAHDEYENTSLLDDSLNMAEEAADTVMDAASATGEAIGNAASTACGVVDNAASAA